jgi:peptide/nickel transport system substrate-binding protein
MHEGGVEVATIRWRFIVALALAVSVLGFQGPKAGAQSAPRQLRVAVGIDADTLDPAGQTTTTVINMIDSTYESLVEAEYVDKPGEIKPELAQRWEVSRDGLTYTFFLRSGATFHDGTPVNAAAVKFSFERLLDPGVRVPNRHLVSAIRSVEVVNDTTVRMTLSQASPVFLPNIGGALGAILSPAAVQRAGARFAQAPVGAGSGPYLFKEWRRGDTILLERNNSYWGKRGAFEEIAFRVVPDAGTRLTQLLAGDVHMAMLPPAPDVKGLRRNPRVTVVEAPTDRTIFLVLNTQWGPLKDVKVRQALNYAINKKALISSILFDLGAVSVSPCPPQMFGHATQKSDGWPFDPIKAKQLLAEAGYKDGFELNFFAPTGRYIQDFQVAQAISAQLRNVGIRANVSTMDWPSYVGMILTPPDRTRVQMIVLGWAWPVLDCDGALYGQFHSSQHPPSGLGPAFYKNDRVDQLLVQGRTTVDAKRRETIYKEAQELIWNDAPWVFLWTQKWYVATVKNLEGVRVLPIEKWDTTNAVWK